MIADRSLRVNLLVRLGIGIVALLALDAIACYYTALYFANLVYDRWLIDSTRSLAKAIHDDGSHISFDLSRDALDVFRFDAVDKTYFKISSVKRGFISGDNELHDIDSVKTGELDLANAVTLGRRIRQVTLRMPAPHSNDVLSISVAETLLKRATLTHEIQLAMVAPQIGLLAIAFTLSWLSIARGLKPLTDLATALEARDHDNLSAVSESGLPHEARVLVARINELLQRVGNALQAQKRFVADAAHQLRTPLAAVMLHAERAQRAGDASTEKAAFQALQGSVQRAARLSQQLLTLARAEPNTATMEAFDQVNLVNLARQVGEDWISIALEHDIDFGLVVPDFPVWIRGNERLLAELLSNLIDNALRYGHARGVVTVSVQNDAGGILAVEDNGAGIPEQERHRIFERFYRLPGSSGEGCGLGLAIVEEIAHLHNAKVTVSSAKNGMGSRFAICFPAHHST